MSWWLKLVAFGEIIRIYRGCGASLSVVVAPFSSPTVMKMVWAVGAPTWEKASLEKSKNPNNTSTESFFRGFIVLTPPLAPSYLSHVISGQEDSFCQGKRGAIAQKKAKWRNLEEILVGSGFNLEKDCN